MSKTTFQRPLSTLDGAFACATTGEPARIAAKQILMKRLTFTRDLPERSKTFACLPLTSLPSRLRPYPRGNSSTARTRFIAPLLSPRGLPLEKALPHVADALPGNSKNDRDGTCRRRVHGAASRTAVARRRLRAVFRFRRQSSCAR